MDAVQNAGRIPLKYLLFSCNWFKSPIAESLNTEYKSQFNRNIVNFTQSIRSKHRGLAMALLFGIEGDFRLFYALGFLISSFLLLNDAYKWLKFKSRGDYELSLLGSIFFFLLFFTDDLLLGILVALFIIMVIETYDIRESKIWSRLMFTFTISYGYLLFFYVLSKIASAWFYVPDNVSEGIFGFGLSTTLWVILITSFIFFGRKFILVSRFLSPNYIYLFVYALTYVIIIQLEKYLGWETRYFILFAANAVIYFVSGPILTKVFGVKPITDPRIVEIVNEVKTKMNVKIRSIGQVNAPILNAFAYGSFFDQRMAFVADDLNQFSDDEIRGIVAHEMAHLKFNHTFWLLLVGLLEMFIKYLMKLPASSYDYLLGKAAYPFIDYYVLNIVIFAVLVIFIRLFEAQADEFTSKMGYGRDLSKSLFKLESFYQGIAGDLGLDVQLLTAKKRTDVEKIRFSGNAAGELYKKLTNPSRMSLLMNIIVSHPLTAFRIAKLIDDRNTKKISKTRLAIFQILLLLPHYRKSNLKLLRSLRHEFASELTENFLIEFDSIESYIETSQKMTVARTLLNRDVICLPQNLPGGIWTGRVTDVKIGTTITSPIVVTLNTGKEEIDVNYNTDYTVVVFEVGEDYLIKNGIATLKGFTAKKSKLHRVLYDLNGKQVQRKYIGFPVNCMPVVGDHIFTRERGEYQVAIVEYASYTDYNNSYIIIKKKPLSTIHTTTTVYLKDVLIVLPPFFILFDKHHAESQKEILQVLKSEQAEIILYEKEDLDIGVPGRITGLNPVVKTDNKGSNEGSDYEIEIANQDEKRVYLAGIVDAIALKMPYILFYYRKEISLGTRIGIYYENRDKILKYI